MPPQPQPPDSIVLSKFAGLKNTVTRERLGAGDLETAVNIDIDDDGQIHRRRGVTQKASGSCHSLFNALDGRVFGVVNGQLSLINPDFSVRNLGRTVGGDPAIGASPLSFVQVGPTIYYTSASDAGKIDSVSLGVSNWGNSADLWLSPVVNPTATLPAIRGRLLGAPPLATQLAYWNGRIYLAQGRTLWFTVLFTYDFVDKTRGFLQYEADVTMIGAVADGIYVGTKEGLWFHSGTAEEGLKRVRVMDSPVIPGSMVYIPGELANPPQVGLQADTPLKVSIGFLTSNGFCSAGDGGEVYNLTESKFFFPTAFRSSAFFRRQDGMNQYIAVNDSGGTPANNARIGDYVDATIIRFTGSWQDTGATAFFADMPSASILRSGAGAANGAASAGG